MKVITSEKKPQIRKINHGDIIQTLDGGEILTYLVDRGGRFSDDNKVFLVGIDNEHSTSYPTEKFEKIVYDWKDVNIFRKDEYCIEIKTIY